MREWEPGFCVELATLFMDPDEMNGYEALRESAAWIDLSARGKIRVNGDDRARLLHALTTNPIQQLTPGVGCYVFFLNALGRVLAGDVTLEDTTARTRTIAVEGPRSAEALAKVVALAYVRTA